MRLVPSLAACLAVCLMLPACSNGPKMVKVAGKLTYKEKPPPVGKGGATVVFHPVVAKGQDSSNYAAVYQGSTGTFTVPGKAGDGIPAGKYRISVDFKALPMTTVLKELNERFGRANTPIVRDLNEDTELNIELTKPQG